MMSFLFFFYQLTSIFLSLIFRYHMLKLYPQESGNQRATKKPVVVETYDEFVFFEPVTSFFHRVKNLPAVVVSGTKEALDSAFSSEASKWHVQVCVFTASSSVSTPFFNFNCFSNSLHLYCSNKDKKWRHKKSFTYTLVQTLH